MIVPILFLKPLAFLGKVVSDLHKKTCELCLDEPLVVLPVICIDSFECFHRRFLEVEHSLPGGIFDKIEVPVVGQACLVLGFDS